MIKDRPVELHYGPSMVIPEGYVVHFMLLPARRLMLKRELGMMILVGLSLTIRLRWPWGLMWWRVRWLYGDERGWRQPILFEWRSTAGEIAARLAERAGWPRESAPWASAWRLADGSIWRPSGWIGALAHG